MCIYMYRYVSISIYMYRYVSISIYLYVCMCIYTYIYLYACTRMYVCKHAHTHTNTHWHLMCTYIHIYVCVYIYVCVCLFVRFACVCVCVCVCVFIYTSSIHGTLNSAHLFSNLTCSTTCVSQNFFQCLKTGGDWNRTIELGRGACGAQIIRDVCERARARACGPSLEHRNTQL